MVKRVQIVGQEPAEAAAFIGRARELIVEKESWIIRVHDGVVEGGHVMLSLETAQALFVSSVTFEAEIQQVIDDVTTLNDDAIEQIIGSITIAKGPVKDILTGPPGGPIAGDRYLIAHSGTSGIFIGKEDQVVEWIDAATPLFSGPPLEGHQVYVQDEDKVYYYTTATFWTLTNPDLTYQARQTALDATDALKAPLASPGLTGVPTAPTAALGTDTTQIATTAFVQDAVDGAGGSSSLNQNGFKVFADGFILQWGFYNGGSATPTIVFPMAFPVVCHNVQCTPVGVSPDTPDEANTPNVRIAQVKTLSATGFDAYLSSEHGVEDVFKSDATCPFYWTAIGK